MSDQPLCPACGSATLSPFGDVSASGGHSPNVHLPLREKKLIGGSDVVLYLIARVCATCGHVAFWVRPEDFGQLRQRWNELEWPAAQ